MKYIWLFFCVLLISCAIVKTGLAKPGANANNRESLPSIIAAIDKSKLSAQKNAGADTLNAILTFELTDRETKEGIAFASFILFDELVQKYVGNTNMDGVAQLKNVLPGTYKIKIAYVGYNELNKVITISKGFSYRIKIKMGYGEGYQHVNISD